MPFMSCIHCHACPEEKCHRPCQLASVLFPFLFSPPRVDPVLRDVNVEMKISGIHIAISEESHELETLFPKFDNDIS